MGHALHPPAGAHRWVRAVGAACQAVGNCVVGLRAEPDFPCLFRLVSGSLELMRLTELQAMAPQLQAIAARYGASNLAVFGSVARDQASESSDVDLLVDLPAGTSLFEHAEFKLDLENQLQKTVDLIRRRNLKPSLRERVESEAVQLG